MKNIGIIDTTFSKAKGLTFKERLTLVRGLAGIGVDAVELGVQCQQFLFGELRKSVYFSFSQLGEVFLFNQFFKVIQSGFNSFTNCQI